MPKERDTIDITGIRKTSILSKGGQQRDAHKVINFLDGRMERNVRVGTHVHKSKELVEGNVEWSN